MYLQPKDRKFLIELRKQMCRHCCSFHSLLCLESETARMTGVQLQPPEDHFSHGGICDKSDLTFPSPTSRTPYTLKSIQI